MYECMYVCVCMYVHTYITASSQPTCASAVLHDEVSSRPEVGLLHFLFQSGVAHGQLAQQRPTAFTIQVRYQCLYTGASSIGQVLLVSNEVHLNIIENFRGYNCL